MRSSIAIQELAAHHALNTLPEVWLDLAHGRLSAEEAAAAAAMAGEEPTELVERSALLFAPPSVEEDERRLERLLQAHFRAPARRRVPKWVLGGVAALAAAGLVMVLLPPRSFEGGYAITMSSGYLEERGEPAAADGVTRYLASQRIELVARPVEREQGVGAVAFVVTEGGASRLSVAPEVKENGVVVLAGTPEALGLPLGRSRIVVVIGPPDELPQVYDESVQDGAEAPYDVVDAAVEIVAAPDRPAP
jgi:hypothetical protein